MSLTLRINGESKSLDAATVVQVLEAEQVDPTARFVAVAINGVVVPRGRWSEQSIADGDAIEIVRPAPGG